MAEFLDADVTGAIERIGAFLGDRHRGYIASFEGHSLKVSDLRALVDAVMDRQALAEPGHGLARDMMTLADSLDEMDDQGVPTAESVMIRARVSKFYADADRVEGGR